MKKTIIAITVVLALAFGITGMASPIPAIINLSQNTISFCDGDGMSGTAATDGCYPGFGNRLYIGTGPNSHSQVNLLSLSMNSKTNIQYNTENFNVEVYKYDAAKYNKYLSTGMINNGVSKIITISDKSKKGAVNWQLVENKGNIVIKKYQPYETPGQFNVSFINSSTKDYYYNTNSIENSDNYDEILDNPSVFINAGGSSESLPLGKSSSGPYNIPQLISGEKSIFNTISISNLFGGNSNIASVVLFCYNNNLFLITENSSTNITIDYTVNNNNASGIITFNIK